jgi:hypothetical protein
VVIEEGGGGVEVCVCQTHVRSSWTKQDQTYTHTHLPWLPKRRQEIVFRSCMLPLLRASMLPSTDIENNTDNLSTANTRAILLSPLLFGLAHLHHGWQRVARDGVPVRFGF